MRIFRELGFSALLHKAVMTALLSSFPFEHLGSLVVQINKAVY